ncbi:MAG: 3-phosphoshikimate 1-carboxyvinyltransferase, partial [bacterium]|nr:3-phosphoshikimate 1-carboxyvinyltransferase [bacterium]
MDFLKVNLRIYKSKKKEKIIFEPPPDKSITHRLFFLSSFAKGRCVIENPLISLDTKATIGLISSIGVEYKLKDTIEIYGKAGLFKKKKEKINCMNSGSTMRIGSGVLAGIPERFYLYGDSSLMKRPMKRIKIPLELMGAKIKLKAGTFPPLIIVGNSKLKAIEYSLKIPSAQVKSAILFAGLYTQGGIRIFSKPSRNHTELMFKHVGMDIVFNEEYVELKKPLYPEAFKARVYGDPSSAAFFAALGILKERKVVIKNVLINKYRVEFYNVLKNIGVSVKFVKKGSSMGEDFGDIEIEGFPSKEIKITKNIPLIIDEIPLLGVIGA